MNLDALPIKVASRRGAGRFTQYNFQLLPGDSRERLCLLVAALPVHGEISVPAPDAGDSYREMRRTAAGFEIKLSRHGAAGT